MSTTAIVVETTIIGFQIIIWLSLGGLAFFGIPEIDLSVLENWIPLLVFAVISVAYTLGLLFEPFIPLIYGWRDKFSIHELFGKNLSIEEILAHILVKDKDIYDKLSSQGNRLNLVRASEVNLFLIFIIYLALAMKFELGISAVHIFISVIIIVVQLVILYAEHRFSTNYFFTVKIVYDRLKDTE